MKMIRRSLRSSLFLVLVSLTGLAWAEGYQYEEGTHYAKLEVPVKTRNPDVVEVTEYFSYGCPHCYRLEPLVQQWKATLPADVEFNRTPAIWRVSGYELYARTYYTAKALGVLEQIHEPLFRAIHDVPPASRILSLEQMTNFMTQHGVDANEFVKTFSDSFGVKAEYQQAVARQKIYRASGVPAIIVNGKYRIEAAMVDNSNAGMLQVASFLIERERRLLSAEASGAE